MNENLGNKLCLHVHRGVPHGGNRPDRLDHMADDVHDGQVDDSPGEGEEGGRVRGSTSIDG